MEKELAPSKKSASKTIFTAFNIIKENHNEMPIKDLLKEIEKKITFTEWEKERYEKSGYIRWQSIFHFYSIDCIKAGYLIKKNGIWYLTPEGIEALKEGEEKLFEKFTKGYKQWAEKRVVNSNDNDDEEEIETETEIEKNEDMLIYNDLLEKALEVMSDFINKKNAYEFQDLVAALLRGMGYYTPFIAPKGKDGGVDIIAYKDPLGTTIPRIQVQIKHKENVASVKEIRELMGLLQKDGDVGIFVSSSGFSSDAKSTARTSNTHIELIDLNRFIELWQNFYNNLSDQDKNLFPLKPIYFLDLNI
jgi:restriction system protein